MAAVFEVESMMEGRCRRGIRPVKLLGRRADSQQDDADEHGTQCPPPSDERARDEGRQEHGHDLQLVTVGRTRAGNGMRAAGCCLTHPMPRCTPSA